MSSFGKYRIFLMESTGEREILADKIISVAFQDSIYKQYSYYNFTVLLIKKEIFPKLTKVKLYYEVDGISECKMIGFLENSRLIPFSNQANFSIYPITYYLSLQGANPSNRYENKDMMQNVIQILLDNLKGSRRSAMNGFSSIVFDGLEIGIIPPLRRELSPEANINENSRTPKLRSSIFDYIQTLANQHSVHITTLIYNEKTYLYFLDNGTIVQDKILLKKVPKITVEDLTESLDSFIIERNPEIMIDELRLFQEGYEATDEAGNSGTTSRRKINLNNLFLKENKPQETAFLSSFFKSDSNLEIVRYEDREAVLNRNVLNQASKFIAETLLSKGMAITCVIRKEKDSQNVDFLIGSYIDISDLFIKSGLTTQVISPYNFIIAGINIDYSLEGLRREIIIAPSFLLET